ncbi:MAG: sigma-70 family RNA polymerase sigma factor, partial [Polyangiales bacterium]
LAEKVAPVETRSPSAETGALVRQALELLPEELANAFVYYYVDQMTHAEIAEVMGCSRRQVGNLLERAHDRLRKLVDPPAGHTDE